MASIISRVKSIFTKNKPNQSFASGSDFQTKAPTQSTPSSGGSSSGSSSGGSSGSSSGGGSRGGSSSGGSPQILQTPNPETYVGGDQLLRDTTTIKKVEVATRNAGSSRSGGSSRGSNFVPVAGSGAGLFTTNGTQVGSSVNFQIVGGQSFQSQRGSSGFSQDYKQDIDRARNRSGKDPALLAFQDIGSGIASPFVTAYGFASDLIPDKTKDRLGGYKTNILGFINTGKGKIDDFFFRPSREEQRNTFERGAFENQQARLNTDIIAFNNEFGGRELNVVDFNRATSSSRILDDRVINLQNRGNQLDIREDIALRNTRSNPERLLISAAATIVRTPLDIAEFGFTPIKSSKGFVTGIKNLPSSFKADPLLVGGSLLGGAALGFGAGAALKGAGVGSRVITTTSRATRGTRVTSSLEIGDIVQTRPGQFVGDIKVSSRVYSTKTGGQIDLVRTDVFSGATLTQEGSGFRVLTKDIAATSGRGQTRYFKDLNKLTKSFDVTTGSGEFFFTPTQKANLFSGKGSSNIINLGKLNLRATNYGTTGRFRQFNLKPSSTGMSDILSTGSKGIPTSRRLGALDIAGEESLFRSRILSDVYPDTLRVRGSSRALAYLRRTRVDTRTPRVLRDLTEGGGKVFSPRELGFKFDAYGSSSKANLPSQASVLTSTDNLVGSSFQAQAKSIARVLEPSIAKRYSTRTITKTTTQQATNQINIPALNIRTSQATSVKLDTSQRQSYTSQANVFGNLSLVSLGLGVSSRSSSRSNSAFSQASVLNQGLKTDNLLIQSSVVVPSFPISPRGITSGIRNPRRPRVPFIPNLFGIKSNQGRSTPILSNIGSRYSPSLTSTSFNIVGDIPKRFRGGVIDPFSRRVIGKTKARARRKKRGK